MAVHLNDGYVKVIRDQLERYYKTQDDYYKAEVEYDRCRNEHLVRCRDIIEGLLVLALTKDKPETEKPA